MLGLEVGRECGEPAGDFDDLCDDPATAADIRQIYRGDIESMDLLVGLLAERPPPGFSRSETAFLHLSPHGLAPSAERPVLHHRLRAGDLHARLDWIDENNMSTVLLRHHPDVAGRLRQVENPFNPWPEVTG